jgi:hypothetical protein
MHMPDDRTPDGRKLQHAKLQRQAEKINEWRLGSAELKEFRHYNSPVDGEVQDERVVGEGKE